MINTFFKARLDEKLNAFQTPTMPRNIWVTLDWMETKLNNFEAKQANDFIVPIVREFFDNIFSSNKKVKVKEMEKIGKKAKRFVSSERLKIEENAQFASIPEENYGQTKTDDDSLVVSVQYLGEIMKSAKKVLCKIK